MKRMSLLVRLALSLIVLPAMMLVSCGKNPEFHISGKIDGIGTQNLRIVYYSDGAMQQSTTSAIDNKFSMIGRTGEPTLVWIYSNTGQLLGRCIVDRGDKVDVEFSMINPLEVKMSGNEASQQLAGFMTDNATLLAAIDRAGRSADGKPGSVEAESRALNRAVEEFVKKNPQSVASSAIIAEFYDFSTGDGDKVLRMLDSLEPEYRPSNIVSGFANLLAATQFADSVLLAGNSPFAAPVRLWGETADSMVEFDVKGGKGRTLIIFSDDASRRADSVGALVERLKNRGNLQFADISFDADTIAWHRSLEDVDARGVKRYWLPGASAAPAVSSLKITRLPFFVVTDSTAAILYRGSSARRAQTVADR